MGVYPTSCFGWFRAAFIQGKRRWLVTAHSTLLAAEVAVAGARGKARSVLGSPMLSRFLPGVSAALRRRPAAGHMCPVRLAWRNEAQAGDHPAACLCEYLNTPNGDVSPAYAFKQEILPY
jgi:hypothetical protein